MDRPRIKEVNKRRSRRRQWISPAASMPATTVGQSIVRPQCYRHAEQVNAAVGHAALLPGCAASRRGRYRGWTGDKRSAETV